MRLRTGEVCDRYSLADDFVHLHHNAGIHLCQGPAPHPGGAFQWNTSQKYACWATLKLESNQVQ